MWLRIELPAKNVRSRVDIFYGICTFKGIAQSCFQVKDFVCQQLLSATADISKISKNAQRSQEVK